MEIENIIIPAINKSAAKLFFPLYLSDIKPVANETVPFAAKNAVQFRCQKRTYIPLIIATIEQT